MTYRRRRTRSSDSEDFLAFVCVAVFIFWFNEQWWWFALFCVSGPVTWWLWVQDTECGVWLENKRRGCANKARGRLGACHLPLHRRRKQNEIRAALGLGTKAERTPFVRRAQGNAQPRQTTPDLVTTAEHVTASPADRLTVCAAVASIPASVATIVATIVQIVGQR